MFFLRFSKDRTLLAIFCCKYSSYSSISSPVSSLESQGSTRGIANCQTIEAEQAEKATFSYGVNSGPVKLLRCWLPSYEDCKEASKKQHLSKVSKGKWQHGIWRHEHEDCCREMLLLDFVGNVGRNSYLSGHPLANDQLVTSLTSAVGSKDTLHPTWPIVVRDWHLQLGYNASQDHTAVVDDLKLQTGNTMKHLPSKCSNRKHWHRSSICTILSTYADASFQFPTYYYTSLISINVNFINSIHLLNLKDAKHTCTQAIQIGAPGDSARKVARWTVLTVWPWDSYNVKALQCKGSLFMLVYRFISCRAKTLPFFSSMWECDDGWLCMGGYLPKEIAQLPCNESNEY